ncbi:unnamed protein product [Musa acuminata subsp. malaccensis]|uniref:(wild Malaysian banana) hypothetical protein n=1 Tax=Musa acuminata subsp. malaccensis TaxID=214687 RepID=A0A804IKH8_MUSAM|nr:PREDICTED: uncharacterized protein LOC103980493 [Musa acuminata subsp. malaccensis]CAG1841059.1 unnamed protein product [Musa acuminata subsp. malaccensis]
MGDQLVVLLDKLKSKMIKSAKKKKKPKEYARLEKSMSVRMEIKSVKARQIITRTLKAADEPGKISISS